jgi:VIT1/CCC1 family predicted Fe2+/Mn2+ transporter
MQQPSPQQTTISSPLTGLVIGLSDGLIIPFALAAALSSAGAKPFYILAASLAGACIGALSMGLGSYFSSQEEADEAHQAPHDTEEEMEALGIDPETRRAILEQQALDQQEWLRYRAEHQLHTLPIGARQRALNTALAYLGGGLLPLLPFMIMDQPLSALKWSAAFVLFSLAILGWVKARLYEQRVLWFVLRSVFWGAAIGLGAYVIGGFFR